MKIKVINAILVVVGVLMFILSPISSFGLLSWVMLLQ